MYMRIYAYTYKCISVYMYHCKGVHECIHIHIHIYIYIYIYICICRYNMPTVSMCVVDAWFSTGDCNHKTCQLNRYGVGCAPMYTRPQEAMPTTRAEVRTPTSQHVYRRNATSGRSR